MGVLRPDRDDAGRARRGRRLARAARARRGAGQGRPLARLHAQLSGSGAQDRRGAEHDRSGDEKGAGGDRRGRPRGAAARTQARAELRGVALPEALVPGRPYDTKDQEGALERLGRSLLAGDERYPALESILRREPFDRPVQTSELRRDEGARPVARWAAARHPGAAGLGEDVDVRTADRAPAGTRQAGGRRVHEPQGDPQPSGRGRGGRCGGGRALHRAQEGELREPGVALRERACRERRERVGVRRVRSRGRDRLALLAGRPRRAPSTTSSSTRPARSRSRTRWRWAPSPGTSSWSAIRSSSTR